MRNAGFISSTVLIPFKNCVLRGDVGRPPANGIEERDTLPEVAGQVFHDVLAEDGWWLKLKPSCTSLSLTLRHCDRARIPATILSRHHLLPEP